MKHLARAILTLAILSLLAAIWIGPWWAWLLTALVLLFVCAGLSGSNVPDEQYNLSTGHLDGELLPEDVAEELTGNSTGPHLHFEPDSRPTYGKPAQKENER